MLMLRMFHHFQDKAFYKTANGLIKNMKIKMMIIIIFLNYQKYILKIDILLISTDFHLKRILVIV